MLAATVIGRCQSCSSLRLESMGSKSTLHTFRNIRRERTGGYSFCYSTQVREKVFERFDRVLVTLRDFCHAINHGDSMRGTIAEISHVNLDSSAFKIWDEGVKPGGCLAQIGRVNNIGSMYRDNNWKDKNLKDKNLEEIRIYKKELKYSEPIY